METELFRLEDTNIESSYGRLHHIYIQILKDKVTGILTSNIKEQKILLAFFEGTGKVVYHYFYYYEQKVSIYNYASIVQKNVSVISEISRLMDNLTIPENIFFSEMIFNKSSYRQSAKALFDQFHINISMSSKIKDLTVLQRIQVELIKAYHQGKSLVLLANINHLLTANDLHRLNDLIVSLKKAGITFTIIETFDDMIFEQTDSLYIIKNETLVTFLPSSQFNKDKIYKIIFDDLYSINRLDIRLHCRINSDVTPCTGNRIALSFQNVSDVYLKNITFSLARGDIAKILCPEPIGQECFISLLRGRSHPLQGQIHVGGKKYTNRNPYKSYLSGIGFVEDNPRATMLFHNIRVFDSLYFPLCSKFKNPFVLKKYKKSIASTLEGILDPSIYNKRISDLGISELNKVVYAKWYLYSPDVLVCINPFSITDIYINKIIENMIHLLTSHGIAVLILTDSWISLIDIPGNFYTLYNGKLCGS